MKKYSAKEGQTALKSQLYMLDQSFKSHPGSILDLCDFLPGVVLINDVAQGHNVFMNKVGCNFLKREKEELYNMGLDYFGNNFFYEPELRWIAHTFGRLMQDKDDKTIGFYQKVRTNKSSPWNYYSLSGKILSNGSDCFIYMGVKIPHDSYVLNKISKTIDIESPNPVLFERFNSLTKREKEVLTLIAKGYNSRDISDLIFLSQLTVEVHRKNLRRKLEARNLRDLIRFANYFDL